VGDRIRLDIVVRARVAVPENADGARSSVVASDPIIPGVIAEEEGMRQRFQGGWILIGMAVLGATMAGDREARAALTGITISGGFKPVTPDPVYEYVLNFYLDPGYSVYKYDFIKVTGLKGVASGDTTFAPSEYNLVSTKKGFVKDYSVSWQPLTDTGSVEWDYQGSQPYINNTAAELFLGQFRVDTRNLTNPGGTPTDNAIVDYSFNITLSQDGSAAEGSGSFRVTDLTTPEPSSCTIVLLTGGTAALSGLIVRVRRRRRARTG
jgi:hypothetical protein